jgi:hypothetical protein
VNKPEFRSTLSAIAQNPRRVQNAFAHSVNQNQTNKQGCSKTATTCYSRPVPLNSIGKSVTSITSASNALNNFDDLLTTLTKPSGSFPAQDNSVYKKLTQEDPFTFPPQAPKSNEPKLIDIDTPRSSSQNVGGGLSFGQQHGRIAPARPPQPTISGQNQHQNRLFLVDPDLSSIFSNQQFSSPNEPNAIVKYPCNK